jgi:anti-sigma factor RsiW
MGCYDLEGHHESWFERRIKSLVYYPVSNRSLPSSTPLYGGFQSVIVDRATKWLLSGVVYTVVMRDPIGGNATLPSGGPLTKSRLLGIVLAFVFFAVVFGYLIAIA